MKENENKEIDKRMNDALKRALNMSPMLHRESSQKKSKALSSKKKIKSPKS